MTNRAVSDPPYLIDSDTGADDAMAILLAAAFAPERLRLLLATYGNYQRVTTAANFATMAALGGIRLPVLLGADGPLASSPRVVPRGVVFAEYSPDFPAPAAPAVDGDFPDALYDALCAAGVMDYIALGPLTSLAMLLERHPDAVDHIRRVVLMGGGIDCANITPYAEYNIYCDAEAAERVFASALEIHMVPLNACTPTALPEEEAARLLAGCGRLTRCVGHLLQIENDLSASFGNTPGIFYDAVALAYYLRPDLFATRRVGVAVSTAGETYGQTVLTDRRSNVVWVQSADLPGYFSLLRDCVERLEAAARGV